MRDRLALALTLVLPVVLVALLGTTVSLTVTDIPIVIQDLDQTPLSRQYADAFRTSLMFRVVTLPPAMSPERMLNGGRVRAAVDHPRRTSGARSAAGAGPRRRCWWTPPTATPRDSSAATRARSRAPSRGRWRRRRPAA